MRRIGPRHAERSTVKYFILLGLLILAVFAIGSLGDILAVKVLVPLLPTPTAAPSDTDFVTESIVLPEVTLYMLQTGIYETAERAKNEAEVIKKRGGAGFVYFSGGYRVFAAGYDSLFKAQNVLDKQKEEPFEAEIYILKSGTVTFSVTAQSEKAASLEEAYLLVNEMLAILQSVSIGFDSGETSATACRARCSSLHEDISATLEKLDAVERSSGGNKAVALLVSYFKNARTDIINISMQNTDSGVDFSSEMKYNYIKLAEAYCQYVDAVL